MPFQPGDKVRFLNESGEGIVIRAADEQGEVIVSLDGFEYPCSVTELIKVEGDETIFQSVNERSFPGSEPDLMYEGPGSDRDPGKSLLNPDVLFRKVNNKGIPEVDLHIEELLDSYKNMTNGEIVDYQLSYFEEVIKAACEKVVRELIVIHGVGEGTLKREVRSYIEAKSNMEYEDAPLRLYGRGATYVRIRGL